MTNNNRKIIPALSLALSALLVYVSSAGFFDADFYIKETFNWQVQSMGQDMIDLFLIVPCLIVTSFLMYRNNKFPVAIWAGIMLYITYSFIIYCFDIHFNSLFLVYCLCLGLSFYSFVYILFTQCREYISYPFGKNAVVRFTGIYFIVIALLFYFLWLAEIVPAIIQKSIPKSLIETGLFTNGVHVIDLSVFLPGVFIAGILLLKKIPLGIVLAPVLLTFFVFMDITIAFLVVVMKMKGLVNNITIAVVMAVLACTSLLLLLLFLKAVKR